VKSMLFTQENLKKVFDQTKTVTRRTSGLQEINKQPNEWWLVASFDDNTLFRFGNDEKDRDLLIKPRYQAGETVYIKEAWAVKRAYDDMKPSEIFPEYSPFIYYSDMEFNPMLVGRWRSPLFMPEWAARKFATITEVSAGRVQEIKRDDAHREGILRFDREHPDPVNGGVGHNRGASGLPMHYESIAAFMDLWNLRNAKPKPVKIKGIVDHFVSYPWEGKKEVREYRGKRWYVCGNPWVFRYGFKLKG